MSGSNKFSLINIDFEHLSDFGKHFLDKMEKLGCFVFLPRGSQRDAIDTYINHVKNLKLNNPVAEAVLIARAEKDIRFYSNNADVVAMAFNQMYSKAQLVSPDIDNIEDEWFSRFFDYTQHVSDEGMKAIWASILAGNLTKPNSIPKNLLHILSVMDKSHAETFAELCKFTIRAEVGYCIVCDYHSNIPFWETRNISLDDLISIESIGLINYDLEPFATDFTKPIKDLNFSICGYPCKIDYKFNINDIPCGNLLLTDSGLALHNCIEHVSDGEAKNHVFNFLREKGYIVTQI